MRNPARSAFAFWLSLFCLSPPAHAAGPAKEPPTELPPEIEDEAAPSSYSPPEYLRRPPALPARANGSPPRTLSLDEARELAMQGNLGLLLEREKLRATGEARALALAAYEPQLQLGVGRLTAESPPATLQEGPAGDILRNVSDYWSLSLSQKLPTGGALRLDFQSGRAESTRGTAVAPLLFRSSLQLSVTQPLLRDFSFTGQIQWSPVLRAQFDSESARESARMHAMQTIKQTEDAYWTLVESIKAYEVNVGAYDLAKQQTALTRSQIVAGILPQSDLIGVLGALSQRRGAVLRAEAQIEAAADDLRALLHLPPSEWDRPILPLDMPHFVREDVAVDDAVARAQRSRPELRQADLDLRRLALDLDLARNARLPRLDVQGSVAFIGQDEDYAAALRQIGQRSGWQWSVGLDLGWAPLGVGARADLRRLGSARRQTALSREQLQVEIRRQIRAAARELASAERQLYAAARSRDLAERSLDVEQRRFLNGVSSNYLVSQRQADLAQARLGELQSLIQHERARSALLLAIGELLEARRIVFEVQK